MVSLPESVELVGQADGPRRDREMASLWSNQLENVWEDSNRKWSLQLPGSTLKLSPDPSIGSPSQPSPGCSCSTSTTTPHSSLQGEQRHHAQPRPIRILTLPPRRHFIRQLIALSLSPAACLPPPSAFARANPRASIQHPSLDPFDATARSIRLDALLRLRQVAARHGAAAVMRALPSYAPPPPSEQAVESGHRDTPVRDVVALEQLPFAKQPHPAARPLRRPRTGSAEAEPPHDGDSPNPLKRQKLDADPNEDGQREASDSQGDDDENDSPLVRAGRQVARCEDCWQLLAGEAVVSGKSSGGATEGRKAPVLDPAGWDLLAALVDIWEREDDDLQGEGTLCRVLSGMLALN